MFLLSIFTLKNTQNTNAALGHRDQNINGFSGILDPIIGTTSTILNFFNEASDLIPVPYVKPLVASIACLLTAVQVSLQNFVSIVLPANDY